MSRRPHPELAAVEVHGVTRSAFLLRGALATASVYGMSALGPYLGRAFAQAGGGDGGVIDFALTLEILEQTFYQQALQRVRGMSSDVKSVTHLLYEDEQQHVTTLGALLDQLAVRKTVPPKLDFGSALSSEASYLRLAQTFEDTGVQAYNGSAPLIEAPEILAAAGSIVQVEARHAAVIRDLGGQSITPGPFDPGVSMDTVSKRVSPYIKN